MKLHASQLPCPEPEFLQKLEAYKAERDAHALTVGVPAPWPEYEIFRTIVDQGGEIVIERDALQEQAKAVNRDALAELDALKSAVAAKDAEIEMLKSKVSALEAAAPIL